MAHSLSAKKRVRQNVKRKTINRARKSIIKTQAKQFLSVLSDGDLEKARGQMKNLTKKLDKAAASGTMHKNTASRVKSRMARRLNKAASA